METYSILRAFADSWFLVAMFAFYLLACAMPFLRSQRSAVAEASTIPFRNDDLPAQQQPQRGTKTCVGNCTGCECSSAKSEV